LSWWNLSFTTTEINSVSEITVSMGRACSAYMGEEKYIQGFGGEI